MTITVVDDKQALRERVEQISVEKSYDIIPISVGLYSMFLAHGKDGLIANMVYQHLIYTARLQETNQVWANDVYLSNALPLGKEAIRRAKTFLHRKGLIKYVQDRVNGKMGPAYIRICFIPSSALSRPDDSVEAPFPDPAPVAPETGGAEEAVLTAEDIFFDGPERDGENAGESLDRYTEDQLQRGAGTPDDRYTGSPVPLFSGGAVDRCTGAGQQMLEAKNEMLETKKEMSLSPHEPHIDSDDPEAPPSRHWNWNPNETELQAVNQVGKRLVFRWYKEFQSRTCRIQNPAASDVADAKSLIWQFPELLSGASEETISRAVEKHFTLWRHAWYLTAEHTRKAPEEQKKPYWNFRNFCRHFAEILELEAVTVATEAGDSSGASRGKRPAGKYLTEEDFKAMEAKIIAEEEAALQGGRL